MSVQLPIVLACLCAGYVLADPAPNSGPLSIPFPLEQSVGWTPPKTNLPPKALSAITELFKQGMADPRGCDYREVEIDMGYESGRFEKTHAWVLPRGKFAVAWNGIVYPIHSAGASANVDEDVADLLAKDEKQWAPFTGGASDARGEWIAGGFVSVRHDDILPIKVAMLLRLGKADEAEAVWKRWFALSLHGADDPYLLIAREWVEALYDRALISHLNAKDPLSLATCRLLLSIQPQVEATAAARGFQPKKPGSPYLEDLGELPRLAADQERRALETPYVQVLDSGLPASGPERIAALVRDLEQVNARQMMNPGQTDVSMDPIVTALIKEGEPGVGPLIKCLEEDTRLTRSEFTQGMQINPGPLIPVYEAAFDALAGIFHEPFSLGDHVDNTTIRHLTLDDRRAVAAKILAYWDKHKGESLNERWFVTLEDDHAGADAWFHAVDEIVRPTTQTLTPQTAFGGGWGSGGPSNAPVPVRGEELRAKANPSVGDLIIKRYRQLIAKAPTDPSVKFEPMGKLILALAAWDGKAHLTEIREMAQDFHRQFPHEQEAFACTLITEAQIFRKRLELGDTHVLSEYADWLTAIDPKAWGYFFLGDPFQIMWHYPNEPVIQRTAEKIFAPHSPWVPFNRIESMGNLLNTPLIGLAAFRREALEGLGDKSLAGTVTLYDTGNGSFVLTGQTQPESIQTWQKGDPDAPPAGKEMPIRLCDYYTYELSHVGCLPQFELYWPVQKRDQTIGACREMLLRMGDRLQDKPTDPYDDSTYAQDSNKVHFSMPRLDHPATAAEVHDGRAIFSLPGTVRVWPMPDYPMNAQRPSHQYDPVHWSGDDGKTSITYTTEGRVWQAEELLVNGRWKRFYGFEGRHQLEQVPASEIYFPSGYGWDNIHDWMDGHLEGPPMTRVPRQFGPGCFVVKRGAPMPVAIKVRNHNGADEDVTVDLTTTGLKVWYSGRIPPEALSPSSPKTEEPESLLFTRPKPPFDYGTWAVLSQKGSLKVTPPSALNAGQDLIIAKGDLRDIFDMNRPGSYRIEAVFQNPGRAEVATAETEFSVVPATLGVP